MNTGNKIMATDLLVEKEHLNNIRFAHNRILDSGPLGQDEILLKVDRFAFTSNNITYAAVGETMHYWDFFPAEDNWGRVPCWGFADILASNHSELKEGERIYGYFPMSTHLRVKAGRVSKNGFYDTAAHRRHLPIVYNQYVRTDNDPAYRKDLEGLHSLFQPLFATSFLLEDYLREQNFFSAANIIITSASSKTAIAFAYLLLRNRGEKTDSYTITGLTSDKNTGFVKSLDLYDDVLTYDHGGSFEDKPSIVVDFAGNKKLLLSLQETLGSNLIRCCMIGISHWEDRSAEGHLQVDNEFFFAPAQAEKRTADWGGNGLREKMATAYIPFLRSTTKWLTLRNGEGIESVRNVYEDMVSGKIDPSEGWVLTMHE